MELEDRLLFSAAPMALVVAPQAAAGDSGQVHALGPQATSASQHTGDSHAVGQKLPPKQTNAQVVLIDSQIENSAQLIENVTPGGKLFVYNGKTDSADSVLQRVIAWADSTRQTIQDLAIVSHGVGGAFQLGNQWISSGLLSQSAGDWQSLAGRLSQGAKIELFGCNVAASGTAGQRLLDSLATLTGAAVFASTDNTGAGGNWQLEAASTGASPSALNTANMPFNGAALAGFGGVLSSGHSIRVDTTNDVLDGDTSSISALLANPGSDGRVSLREAITAANNTANAGSPDTIGFNLPGGGGQTIHLLAALPAISDAVIIDGTTQGSYSGTPIIVIDGASAGAAANGFDINAGGSTIRGLVIDNFGGYGISIGAGGGNTIAGNYIGIDAAGTSAAANGSGGVFVATSNNILGGTVAADRNIISGNAGSGVIVSSGTQNTIVGNSIYNNAGLGIDLNNDGVTANGLLGLRSGPNNLENYPVLSSAAVNGTSLTVAGTLTTGILGNYQLDFYWSPLANPSGYGEGQNYIGSITVSTGLLGSTAFNTTFTGVSVPAGAVISATATDTSGNTSEFSQTLVATGTTNHAPQLSGANDLGTISEDPAANPGTRVSSLLSGKISDADSGSVQGIAVTAVDNSRGAWQYSTDGGSTWSNFGSPNTASARLLAANANTYVRFVPNANMNGTVAAGITFQAWDQTSGLAGSTANSGTAGGATAFSIASASAGITVAAVNDAPTGTSNTVTTLENTSYTFAVADFGLRDLSDTPPGNLLAVKIATLPVTGILSDNGVAVTAGQFVSATDINAARLVFTPMANASGAGNASFSFQVQDNGGTANGGVDFDPVPKTMTLDVTYVNQPPTVAAAASATPNAVVGTTASLSVLGADDMGESNLTYRWAVTSAPVAVHISDSGANSSKNTTVTFSQAGNYTFQVTVTDAGGLATTSTVSLAVAQTMARIDVSPAAATLVTNTSQRFVATAYDQFGNTLAVQPTFQWTLVSGNGTLDASGVYTAPDQEGGATIRAASGSMLGSAALAITAVNQILIPLPPVPAIVFPSGPGPAAVLPAIPTIPPVVPTVRPAAPALIVPSRAAPLQRPLQAARMTLPVPQLQTMMTLGSLEVIATPSTVAKHHIRDVTSHVRTVAGSDLSCVAADSPLWEDLEALDHKLGSPLVRGELAVGAALTVSTAFTVGYVIWMLRGGMLLSSLLAQMPAWRLLDPIVVLNGAGEFDDREQESLATIVDSLEDCPSEAVELEEALA